MLPGKNADESFWGIGFPSFALYEELPPGHPDRGEVRGSAQGWWWHSTEDTIDYCDKDILNVDTRLHADAILRYCGSPILPYDLEQTALQAISKLQELAQQSEGRFDPGRALVWAQRFRENAAKLMALQQAAAGDHNAINAALMKVTRAVNPAIYTRSGRFSHDYTVPTAFLPGLEDAGKLARLDPESDVARFIAAKLARERNRLIDAFKHATSTLAQVVPE